MNLKYRLTFSLLAILSFSQVLVANVNAQTKPTKAQCVESLNLTSPQKEQLLKIKQETADKKAKLEQFIAELSPAQTKQLEACMKASK